MRILHIEDNPMDGDLTRRELARHAPQYQINTVTSLRAAAVHLAQPAAYDLVLTDLRLPDGDGLDLLTQIRSQGLPLAIVVVTGSGDEETAVAVLKAGADDYIVKRNDYLARLPVVLEEALHHHHAESALHMQPIKVLYAEHNVADVDLTLRHMAHHTAHITFAIFHTAAEVLHHLDATGYCLYDVFLLDYRLPGANALELLKELRQVRRLDTPVVLITGHGDEDVARQALKLGAAEYLVKSAGYLHRLPGTIENVYYRSKLMREQAALRESEARLREAQRLGRIGNWEFDVARQTITWSDVVYELYGRDPQLGPPSPAEEAAYYTSAQAYRLREYARRAIEHGESAAYDLAVQLPSGRIAYFAATMRPIYDQQQRVVKLFGTVQDITERQLEAERLELVVTELARSNAELERFAYVASHDLQEPLRMVASFVQLLAQRYQGRLDADADEFIGFAVEGAKRMQQLILDLLEYSRAGTRGRAFELTDCEAVLAQVERELAPEIENSSAQISHAPLPQVMVDRAQLVQLLANLVFNALKFRSAEPPRIHVAAERRVTADELNDLPVTAGNTHTEWLFSVEDNGIGIDPQYHERIFGIYQRLHTRERYPGTGIGLALCRKIVERHGGRIWVESQPGRGTTFFFTIPER